MQITKNEDGTITIADLTKEQTELIRIASSVVCETQNKAGEQSCFLRGLAMKLDKLLNQ